LSIEHDDRGAKSSYMCIIEECSKVFSEERFVIASMRKNFTEFALVYYMEFILSSIQDGDKFNYLDGVIIPPDDNQLQSLARALKERMVELNEKRESN